MTTPATHLTPREVARTIRAHRQTEGGGFIVRRPVPIPGVEHLDPFLLIDEMGPAVYGPGEAVGAPDHPHRGFETVTYMLDGEFEHEDSAGHRGTLRPGDVQWMTAGAGIVHSEMPAAWLRAKGGRVHGFQIWVNLPARLKMTQPRYQELQGSSIPRATTPDGLAEVVVIAGAALGIDAAIATHTPITYQDWTLKPGADVTVALPGDQTVLLHVFGGSLQVGDKGQMVGDGTCAVLGEGAAVRLRGGAHGGRALLLAGTPHREPVARYGPFVMNTRAEIQQAIDDYRSGKLGEITRTARHG